VRNHGQLLWHISIAHPCIVENGGRVPAQANQVRVLHMIVHNTNYQHFGCYGKAVVSYLGKAETSHVMLADL
jgi:hypothetical protein